MTDIVTHDPLCPCGPIPGYRDCPAPRQIGTDCGVIPPPCLCRCDLISKVEERARAEVVTADFHGDYESGYQAGLIEGDAKGRREGKRIGEAIAAIKGNSDE